MGIIPDVRNDRQLVATLKGPYNGMVVNDTEYPSLENVILLHNLRELYYKILPDIVLIVDRIENFTLNNLKENCPDHYSNIFENETEVYNISLILEKFPIYYNFIKNFVVNEITVEEFKEMYSEIVTLLKTSIGRLIVARNRLRYYEKNNISLYPIINKVTNPEKIIWKKNKEKLETLFENLLQQKFIEEVRNEDLLLHFSFLNKESEVVTPNKFKPIIWKETDIYLGVLFDELVKLEYVSFYKNHINKAIREHFIDNIGHAFDNIEQSRYNAKITKNPRILYKKVFDVINYIK
jgi:hypothetical protein